MGPRARSHTEPVSKHRYFLYLILVSVLHRVIGSDLSILAVSVPTTCFESPVRRESQLKHSYYLVILSPFDGIPFR